MVAILSGEADLLAGVCYTKLCTHLYVLAKHGSGGMGLYSSEWMCNGDLAGKHGMKYMVSGVQESRDRVNKCRQPKCCGL